MRGRVPSSPRRPTRRALIQNDHEVLRRQLSMFKFAECNAGGGIQAQLIVLIEQSIRRKSNALLREFN